MYINADMRSYIISCAATLSYYEACWSIRLNGSMCR